MTDDLVEVAYSIAGRYFLPGGDRDDLRQEALIGALEAERLWDPVRGLFKPFAILVIERHLMTVLSAANRRKHSLLTAAVREYPETLPACDDVAYSVEQREHLREVADRVRRLSGLERRAWLMSVNERPYMVGGVKDKQIDNALQRARRKVAA